MNIVNSINFFRKKENFFYLLLCLYPWLLISGPFLSDSVAIILSINYLFIKISYHTGKQRNNFLPDSYKKVYIKYHICV